MGSTTQQRPSLKEVIDSQGRKIGWVAEQLSMRPQVFARTILNRGRATEQERAKLAEVLGLTLEEIAAALAETARRAEGGAA